MSVGTFPHRYPTDATNRQEVTKTFRILHRGAGGPGCLRVMQHTGLEPLWRDRVWSAVIAVPTYRRVTSRRVIFSTPALGPIYVVRGTVTERQHLPTCETNRKSQPKQSNNKEPRLQKINIRSVLLSEEDGKR